MLGVWLLQRKDFDMSAQWGHGFHKGREHGEEFGQLIGQGERELQYSKPADRLFLLANALQLPAEVGKAKSHVWWGMYACTIAREMREIAEQLPSVMANVLEQPMEDETPNA